MDVSYEKKDAMTFIGYHQSPDYESGIWVPVIEAEGD